MTFILAFALVCVSLVAVFFIFGHFKDVRTHKAITEENAELTGMFEKLRSETQQATEKFNQIVEKYNSDLERWKNQHNSALEKWKEKYSQDQSKWKNAYEDLQKQNLTLKKWKEFLKPEEEAKKLVEQASKMLWDAEVHAKQIIADAELKAGERENEAKKICRKADDVLEETQQTVHRMMIAAEIKAKERDREVEIEAEKILQAVKQKAAEIEAVQRKKLEKVKIQIDEHAGMLIRVQSDIEEAHKVYKYRKTLPDSHDKLKARYDDLKEKHDRLKEDFKEAKSTGKASTMSSREKEKYLTQFDKLARTYIEDNFKFVLSKMTTNNFTASRDRVLKAVQLCRSIGFDLPETMEDEYAEKIREEFKRVLRIEEMRLEQQRIKEQIREEQKALRELKKLEEKEQQAIKEHLEAEEARAAMQRAIEEALADAHGEHTSQIEEMEKALAEKDAEIAAKQQEIEDNQRAISNAQLTKAGHVYVLSNIGSFDNGVFKIGMTRRTDPQDRVKELGDASVPFPFDVHLMVGCDNAPGLEKRLHRRFNNMRINRVNLRKEYFRVSVDEVRNEIQSFLDKDVDYVADPPIMEEYAEQYRQSQMTTLEDIEEVEELYQETGIDIDGEE